MPPQVSQIDRRIAEVNEFMRRFDAAANEHVQLQTLRARVSNLSDGIREKNRTINRISVCFCVAVAGWILTVIPLILWPEVGAAIRAALGVQ